MEAYSTQDSPSPPLSGFSVPIRAPLTIDSDSEFCLSINGHNYSRTSSFNSSSSIDLSSYGDEHISVLEEQDDESFVAYPDEEIVVESSNVKQYSFTRAFVKYPDGNCVNESSSFDKNDIFKAFVKYPDANCVKESSNLDKNVIVRPFVKYPDGDYVIESSNNDKNLIFRPFVKCQCEEGSSADFGIKLGVPFAHLTSDCDSDIDLDSDDGLKFLISGDGIVQKIEMAPKVRIISGDEDEDEGDDELQVSGDDINGIEELNSVLAESIEDEGCRFYYLNEVVALSDSDALSVDSEKIDADIVSDSNNEIEIETISVQLLESDKSSCDLERIDADIVSDSNNEIEIETLSVQLPESDKSSCDLERIDAYIVSDSKNEIEIEALNVKLQESDKSSCDLERIDAYIVSDSKNEIEIETLNVKLQESDKSSCDLERFDADIVSDSNNEIEIETISVQLLESDKLSCDLERFYADIVSDSNNEIEIETISVKLQESDKLSCDLERINVQNVSSSNNEAEIKTINLNLPESDELSFREKIDSQIASDSSNETEIETELDEMSFDSEKLAAHIVSSSENEIEIKTISEHKQEVIGNFLKFALSRQLTTKVNAKGEFDFHLTILVIGKTGTGKSATINSIFGETKTITNAFRPGTSTILEITGKVDGIRLRILDTPGFKSSPLERSYNLKILKSIKRFSRKNTPNLVLYVDRLDTYANNVNDSHLLTLITRSLGSSVWRNCIIALTHAASDPPDESSGGFVVQRSCFIQEQIVRVRGTNREMVNPVWLVENDPSCFKFSGLDGLTCFDREKEDGCESVDVTEGCVERKRAYFGDCGYRVKLVGNKHWSLACRLYF